MNEDQENKQSESSTLYLRRRSIERVASIIRLFEPAPSHTVEPAEGCDTFCVESTAGSLTLSCIHRVTAGDRFSKLILGTHNFFRSHASLPTRILEHIQATELLIGIVARPDISSDPRFLLLLTRVARDLDGLFFDGQRMLDADFQPVYELNRNA